MSKLALGLSVFLLSAQVFAAATLKVPFILVDDHTGKTAPVAKLNQKLADAGLTTLPEFITISNRENGYRKIERFQAQLEKSLKALGEDSDSIRMLGGYYPTFADLPQYKTCYSGDIYQVVEIVRSLTDIFYSDQMTLQAMKFKSEAIGLEEGVELDNPDTMDYFNSQSPLWKNWQSNNGDLLILSSITDDGTDIQESLIPVCQ